LAGLSFPACSFFHASSAWPCCADMPANCEAPTSNGVSCCEEPHVWILHGPRQISAAYWNLSAHACPWLCCSSAYAPCLNPSPSSLVEASPCRRPQ
jgi:hypothetical protein